MKRVTLGLSILLSLGFTGTVYAANDTAKDSSATNSYSGSWNKNSKGWWYEDESGWYPQNKWLKIDGSWYFFKARGYAAQSEFVKGWWLGKNCAWNDPVRYSWHKTIKGWWYGVPGGWYAKNAAYVIDGVNYAFDEEGYLIEEGSGTEVTMSYEEFKSLTAEEQIKVFNKMSSEAVYELIKASSESWVVNSYDLITPQNVKGFAILRVNDQGETSFNIDWPKYGGNDPNTIASIIGLTGTFYSSRVGGDGGYTISFGKNADGTYPNCSQRSMPVSSSELNTGTFDVDRYIRIVDIITSEGTDEAKKDQLKAMGIDADVADCLMTDYANWRPRAEISGEGNIEEGFRMEHPGVEIVTKYGFYGETAKWDVQGLHMEGGAGQMNIVFSWGTCKKAGILTNIGKTTIY